MNWQRGDVVVVAFPYTESDGRIIAKGRPALVVSGDWVNRNTADVIVAAISSRVPRQQYPTDLPLVAGTPVYAPSGLTMTSIVKGAALATIAQQAVSRRLGRLDQAAMTQMDACLRAAFGL